MAPRENGMDAMNRARMQAILEAYGAAPARWPETERAAALAWAKAEPEVFASIARDEAALDSALALDRCSAGDASALATRIVASMPGGDNIVRPAFARRGAPQSMWRQALALAACAMIGLAIGFANGRTGEDDAYELDAAFGAAFQTPGSDFVDGVGG